MLPEIGASELLIIAVVALIVVGPKDLPVLLRKLGQFMSKLRGMASEFRASFDEMARQSELDDLRKEVEAMRRGQLADTGAVHADVSQAFSDIETSLNNPADAYWPADYAATAPAPVTIEKIEDAPKPARARKSAAKTASATADGPATKAPTKKAATPRKPKPPAEPSA